MAGETMVPLTEQELALLAEWGTWLDSWKDEDLQLYRKIGRYLAKAQSTPR